MSLESTVVSLIPFEIRSHKPGLYPPYFYIEASDMKTPKLLHVDTAYHFLYMDETRGSIKVPNPSDVVARAIVDDYINSQISIDDEARPALFWVPERLTVEEVQEKCKIEIIRYLLKQKKWFLNIAMLADNDWSRYHQHNVISSFQRKCADIIGWTSQEHEWMSPQTTMRSSSCPYCGISVPEGIPICSNGHTINPKLLKEIEERLVKV
jgi:hypothetical protein